MPDAAVPRPAATVMLLRDGPGGLEVFMTVRHAGMDFMPGALVFPGGGVDPADAAVAGGEAGAVRVAAVREVFEECGILLARGGGARGTFFAEADVAPLRARYAADAGDRRERFARMVLREELALATDDLVPFARWITPAARPKRFDTHFFLAACPSGQTALHDGAEAVDSLWITPAAALAGHAAERFDVVLPTEMNLIKLGRARTVADALAAAGSAPVVTVSPEMVRTGRGVTVRIPLAAGYGVEELVRRADRNLPPPDA